MDDPDVVLVVDPDADRHAEQPAVRQRLRPQRIDLEARRLDTVLLLCLGRVLKDGLPDTEPEHCGGKYAANHSLALQQVHAILPCSGMIRGPGLEFTTA